MMSFKKFPTFKFEGKDISAPFLISSLILGVIGLIISTLSLMEIVDILFLDSPLYDFFDSLVFAPSAIIGAYVFSYLRDNLQIRYDEF